MPLARFDKLFEHPDWIFEPKLDGFRAVGYVEDGSCRLVSRNRNAFRTFESLAQAIGQQLAGRSAILDGEIVRPGPDGRLCRQAGRTEEATMAGMAALHWPTAFWEKSVSCSSGTQSPPREAANALRAGPGLPPLVVEKKIGINV